MTTAIEIVLFSLLGLTVGSFLNVCSDRLPQEKSIISPPSHCDACQQKLTARDLVPLFSYLWLRGRCRYCGARISPRFPAVELATALLFALLTWHYGLSPELVMALIYGCLFLVIFVVDLEHGLVLDIVVYPGIVLAFIFSFFWPDLGIAMAVSGAAIGFGLMLIPYLISRGGMGGGDVKLAALIGLATGFPHVFISLMLAFLAGGLVAIFLLLFRVRSRKEAIPFAPFLAAAAMVTLIWGEAIYDWWVGLV
jgi:leader peptidase (prepilin peptidase)/N-methyltransferase